MLSLVATITSMSFFCTYGRRLSSVADSIYDINNSNSKKNSSSSSNNNNKTINSNNTRRNIICAFILLKWHRWGRGYGVSNGGEEGS